MPADGARKVGRAVTDGAVNPRHNLELVGALLVGSTTIDPETLGKIQDALLALGVGPEWLTAAGAAMVAASRLWSLVAKIRRRQEVPT